MNVAILNIDVNSKYNGGECFSINIDVNGNVTMVVNDNSKR